MKLPVTVESGVYTLCDVETKPSQWHISSLVAYLRLVKLWVYVTLAHTNLARFLKL